MNRRLFTVNLLMVTAAVISLAADFQLAVGADHAESPTLGLAPGSGSSDISDIFVFRSPTNPDNTVLIMTVNPMAGIFSPVTFSSKDIYEFRIESGYPPLPDRRVIVSFTPPASNGSQQIQVQLDIGGQPGLLGRGQTGRNVPLRGGGMLRAGLFDDPFFFDLVGFENGNFTGDDYFAGLNVSAIVLEMPSRLLGYDGIRMWGRTVSQQGARIQIDRMGRPAINSILIPRDYRDRFNAGRPDNDLHDFGEIVAKSITELSGDPEYASTITSRLLPDVITFDSTIPYGFFNGRRLEDDVMDSVLRLVTAGATEGDLVAANDVPFQTTFPYLAAPHVYP